MLGIGNWHSQKAAQETKMSLTQKIFLAIWILLILAGLGTYWLHPEWFTPESISGFIEKYHQHMLLVYFLISIGRGIFLIPSTPFVMTGAALFPHDPWTVFVISMAGVMAGTAFVFFFTEFLGLDKPIKKRFGKKMAKVSEKMEKYGFWIVLGWAFFPAVPTDLVAYTAGISKMSPWKFFSAIFLGELPLVAFYVFTGMALGEWLF